MLGRDHSFRGLPAKALMISPPDRALMTIAYIYHLNASVAGYPVGTTLLYSQRAAQARYCLTNLPSPTNARCLARGSSKIASVATGKRYLSDRHPGMLRDFANEAMRRLSGDQYDIVFSPSTLADDIFERPTRPVTVRWMQHFTRW